MGVYNTTKYNSPDKVVAVVIRDNKVRKLCEDFPIRCQCRIYAVSAELRYSRNIIDTRVKARSQRAENEFRFSSDTFDFMKPRYMSFSADSI